MRDVIAETLLKNLGLTAEVDLSGVANRTETGNIDAVRTRQWTTDRRAASRFVASLIPLQPSMIAPPDEPNPTSGCARLN